jgi:hypothetical protein
MTGSSARGGAREREDGDVADKKGKGSDTAKKANAKAAKEGKSNPRKSSAAQSELGKKGGKKGGKKKGKKS